MANNDIYISYAKIDNEPFPGYNKGWIEVFVGGLRVRLAQKLGRHDLFSLRMGYEERVNQEVASKSREQIASSQVFLIFLSPGYLESDWCSDEMKLILEQRSSGNIFLIEMHEMERPEELRDLLVYPFWRRDSRERIRKLGSPVPDQRDRDYYEAIDDLSSDISLVLKKTVKSRKKETQQFRVTPEKKAKAGKKTSVFISYSHMDKDYLERLRVHLKPIERRYDIELWDDSKIRSGEKWRDEIASALGRSAIAILLISADFLASDFIVKNELPPLLISAEERGTTILPLVLKPCLFTFDENLSMFQSLNDPQLPLIKLTESDQEDLFVGAAMRVQECLVSAKI